MNSEAATTVSALLAVIVTTWLIAKLILWMVER